MMDEKSNRTLDFYNTQAPQYVAETVDLDVSNIRNLFLNHIPEGGHILDLGCGSGRDSRFFLAHGCSITAVDASDELANLASEFIGQPVENLSFQEIDYLEAFDGIWACASLLHCPKSAMGGVMQRMTKALKPNGIIYMSFKYGTDERIDERGRFFNDYTEASMSKLLAEYAELQIVEIFTETKPLRSGFQTWLNVFARKHVK
ncbi:class I SAM-dependent methyltransferase [Methylomonas rapida]|uniref:Class I SAM-dependent methyltransferase n=1 Tax=Methylomonas rapida TaxID=2963939 RepID=A0ABY7GK32_9GAMM|nr:class I SAM-dependent methyltransferase [Methylomonas rapida]WAR43558.1 class I SAM-dependent methyltransferase [Methylomonas rapida]